ncbi:MAG: signal peptidase II [Acidobacteria bacterium]|nr:signal peptidase II [Acidobacteriota bacterium]
MSAGVESPGALTDHRRLHRLEIGLASAIVVADQVAKAIVRADIPLHESVTVVPGFLYLTHVRNTGAAFGFLNAVDFPYKSAVVALVATAALVAIAFYAARVSPHERVARVGLAMILGGAVGNLIDRLALGSVVDYVDVVFGTWHFWAFNVADSAITLGVVAMMIDMIGLGRHVSTTS